MRDDPSPDLAPTRSIKAGFGLLVGIGALYALGAQFSWGWLGASWGLTFFLPAGLTLSAMTLAPRRFWPFIVAGIVVAEFGVDRAHGLAFAASSGYAFTNAVEPVIGAVSFRALCHRCWSGSDRADLETRKGVLAFLGGAVVAGPLGGAVLGATIRSASGSGGWLISAASWWAGDGLGVLVVGGAILMLAQISRSRPASLLNAELAIVLVAVLVVSFAVLWVSTEPMTYLLLPLMWWAAVRFRVTGVTLTGLIVALVTNVATAEGHGPFHAISHWSPQSRVVLAQIFVAVAVLSAWTIALEVSERERSTHERDVEASARRSAESAQIALAAARRAAESAMERLRLLGAVSEAVNAVLEPGAIASRLQSALVPFADSCAIFVPEIGGLRRESASDLPGAGSLLPYESREPASLAYMTASVLVHTSDRDRLGVAVPLRARGKTIGVLQLVANRNAALGPDDLEMVSEIAARVAVALDNATRFRLEHEIASVLQQAVQPPALPELDGLTLDAVYRPAAEGIEVGGDWYDVIVLDEGRAVFALGDVMGKGLHAAVAMAAIRSALRAYARIDPDPASVVSRLDLLVSKDYGGTFITLVYVLLDSHQHTVTIAHAGHPPALHLRGSLGATFVNAQFGTPLGLGWDRPCPTTTLTLLPGEGLLLYSDGAVEDRQRSITEGLADLAEAVDSVGSANEERLCRTVAELLAASDDDLTMLSVFLPPCELNPIRSLDFRAHPSSVAAVRRFVSSAVSGVPVEPQQITVALASELAANAVRHAESDYIVAVEVSARRLLVTVTDRGRGTPQVGNPSLDAVSGRGLRLVESLADRWGVDFGDKSKSVWFEIAWEPTPLGTPPGALADPFDDQLIDLIDGSTAADQPLTTPAAP